jgi:hypothetical protein
VTVVTLGMALGGLAAAAYIVFGHDEPATAPPPADTGTPRSLAEAVVGRLNAKDLDGVINLTCAQGKVTGRRELVKAIPALDPAAPANVRETAISFELRDVNEFPEGYVAAIAVNYQGSAQDGKMRIQRSGEKWTLCGMDAPRIGAAGLTGTG